MECKHEWEEYVNEMLKGAARPYNPNGEYVEGFGWEQVFVPIEMPKEYRCKKCNSLKKGDKIFPPLEKPIDGFVLAPDGCEVI